MHSNARCTPQPACSKGTFYEDSDTFERRCRPCEDGTYQALPSHRSVDCVVQSVCTKGEVFVNGDNEQAGNCAACPMGTYQPSSAHRDAECLQQANCTTGTFISNASATSVRECFPCPERQFQANDEHQIAECSPVEASLCSEDDRGRTRCCNSAGTLSADTGKCKCVDGYTGDDCSEVGAGCRATDSITQALLENEMRTTISKVIPPVAIITASSIATSYVYMLRSGKPQFADAFSKLTWRAHAWACLTVGLKVFDLQTDWSFFFVSLRGEPFESRFMLDGNETVRYTETGRYNSHVSAIQFTAFGSCLLGSVLTFFDIYGTHQRLSQIITVATPITLAVMITEDMPQLAMNIIYMDTMKNREVDNMFEDIDTIAMVSFVASILNVFYSIYLILSDRCLAKKQKQKAKKEEAQARRGRAADAFVGTVDQVIAVGREVTKVVAASINQDRQIDAGAGSIRASAIATQNPVYNAGSANSANTHPYKAAPLIDAPTTRLHTQIASQVAEVLHSYTATEDDQISIVQGQLLTILDDLGAGWCHVRNDWTGEEGLAPSRFLSKKTSPPASQGAKFEISPPPHKARPDSLLEGSRSSMFTPATIQSTAQPTLLTRVATADSSARSCPTAAIVRSKQVQQIAEGVGLVPVPTALHPRIHSIPNEAASATAAAPATRNPKDVQNHNETDNTKTTHGDIDQYDGKSRLALLKLAREKGLSSSLSLTERRSEEVLRNKLRKFDSASNAETHAVSLSGIPEPRRAVQQLTLSGQPIINSPGEPYVHNGNAGVSELNFRQKSGVIMSPVHMLSPSLSAPRTFGAEEALLDGPGSSDSKSGRKGSDYFFVSL